MKQIALTLALIAVISGPVAAQDADNPNDDLNEGIDLLGRGAELLLQGLLAELGPAWSELQSVLNDLNAYYPPEILPNGDILIRRKPADPSPGDAPDDEATEL